MRPDVIDLNAFYTTRLGHVARRLIRQTLRAAWPNVRGEAVLGLGYTTPYLGLYREQAEEALGQGAGSGNKTCKQKPDIPLVQVQIADPQAQALLTSMLLAMGFEPTLYTSSWDQPEGVLRLITYVSPSAIRRRAYEQLGVSVLDYGAFKKANHVDENAVDVSRLWAWLATLREVGV